MRLHTDVDTHSDCRGQVADGDLFGTHYWCVYCGAKWSEDKHHKIDDAVAAITSAQAAGDYRVTRDLLRYLTDRIAEEMGEGWLFDFGDMITERYARSIKSKVRKGE